MVKIVVEVQGKSMEARAEAHRVARAIQGDVAKSEGVASYEVPVTIEAK